MSAVRIKYAATFTHHAHRYQQFQELGFPNYYHFLQNIVISCIKKLSLLLIGEHGWLPARGAPCTCLGIHLPSKTKCHPNR